MIIFCQLFGTQSIYKEKKNIYICLGTIQNNDLLLNKNRQKSQRTEIDLNDSWKHSARFCVNKSLVRARFQHCSDRGNAFVCRNIIFHPSSLIWSPDYDLSRCRIVEKLANACRATADEDALPFPQQEKSRKYRQDFQRAR